MNSTVEFLIGSYSQDLGESSARGEGIYSAGIDLQTGALSDLHCAARCVNPSYLAWGPGRNRLYATRETHAVDGPAIVSFDRNHSQHLQLRQTVLLPGEFPCHVAIDATGRLLTSAQYGSGDIAVLRLAEGGHMIQPAQMIRHSGRGLNSQRQEGPHAHYAEVMSPPGILLVVDLGLDSVIAYPIDLETLHVSEQPAFSFKTNGGAGPRHLATLSGSNTAYLYCELNDEIYQLTINAKGCECIGIVRAFDDNRSGVSAGAAIKVAPDQRHLYVSGRAQSKIAAFEINRENKQLKALTSVDTGGVWPRDFSITPDGSYLVVANEKSNNVTSLRRHPESGLLELTGSSIGVGSPVCIVF